MKKIFLGVLLSSSILIANSLKGGYPACTSKKDLSDFSMAGVKKDYRMMNYLVESGNCVITKKGIKIDILDSSIFSGNAKVRVWIGKTPVEVWTNIENIEISTS